MNEKEIMTVKQVSEYLQMDEHTVYKLARTGLIPSLNPALSSIYEKIDTLNKSGLIRIVRSILRFIERAGAGQWRFKKDVIDKWISKKSLERVTQNIKSSRKKKSKGK